MAVTCLRCLTKRKGNTRRPCPTPDCHGVCVPFPHAMRKVVMQFHRMGFEIEAAYAEAMTTPAADGFLDDVAWVCLSFGRIYDTDCFPGELPDMFDILHFDDIGSTRLSFYTEYYFPSGVRSDARKDIKQAIEELWQYSTGLEAEGFHHILQMGGRL